MPEPLPESLPDPAAPPPPTLRRLFLGDDGLRAGWSLLFFAILATALLYFGFHEAFHHHLLPLSLLHPTPGAPRDLEPRVSVLGEFLQFAAFAFAALVLSFVERRPFRRFGFTARRMLPDFLAGLFWGLLMLSLLVGALLLTHAIAFDGVFLHSTVALAYAAKWGLLFLLVGLFEEFSTRGYLQFTLARGVAGIARAMSPATRYAHALGFWVSAFLFSVCLFMAGHLANPGETPVGIVAVGLAGAVFAFSLWRTGSLWWAVGFHTAWDWAQSFLYGVADSGAHITGHLLASHALGSPLLSGGSDGPEGSLLAIPTLLLVALIIHFTLPRRPYPLTFDQTPPPLSSRSERNS